MLVRIRAAVQQSSGVGISMIVGSHTHHGPVIELLDEPGKGRGAFDDAVAYAAELEQKIIQVIQEAAAAVRPARIGWGAKHIDMNRNRHSNIEPKPVDPELGVIRLDDLRRQADRRARQLCRSSRPCWRWPTCGSRPSGPAR
jgi:neutral ceramidase